ncbi:hypothetical protein HJP15_10010 [Pseudoalteromonas sp. NEC-BIFX-2020_002]|uniref:hypothetical protein n=1 Tax=Pseudoalteromonas sp. NEC-BIFX-2020_002 TaxID=2732353 RepID=UPI001476B8D4|nr:hypothetical protein [Pseudoalteromonas sp. NEC-BIFX-2020_002]NNG43245.1 hypothetical protein [Pseudoalteromonas sp. NEC-BIFX-2020_002]
MNARRDKLLAQKSKLSSAVLFTQLKWLSSLFRKYVDPNGELKVRARVATVSPQQSLINARVNHLVSQIRQVNTTFSGLFARPSSDSGSQHNMQTINALQSRLNNAQQAGFCGPGASNPRPTDPTTGMTVGRFIVN